MEEKEHFSVWIRLGVMLDVTKDEMDALFSEKSDANSVLKRIISEGRFEPDGDSYIPESEVFGCNEAYGTDYELGDWTFEL